MEHDFLTAEVEDIMCDQVIISTELDVFESESNAVSIKNIRFALALFTKSLLPAVVGIYYAYLKNQKTVVDSIRRRVLPTIVAFIVNNVSRSLSSVQRGITYPLTIGQKLPSENTEPIDDTPEKSVICDVLTQPEEIKADVIFIHGLHGSLRNTWRQGDWRHENHHLQKVGKMTVERSFSMGDIGEQVRNISLKRASSDISSRYPSKISKMEKADGSIVIDRVNDNERSNKKYSECWPRDWLPIDCPGARVIALNYTTDPYLWRPVWIKKKNRTCMTERSMEMIEHLLNLGVGKHPIIWVGHSKGGLFVKQIIIDAWENKLNSPDLRSIHDQTSAIMFYSVPHKGSYLADVTLPFLKRSIELTEIRRNCPFVLDLHKRFLGVLDESKLSPEVFSFIETSFTLMSIVYLKIVAYESANPDIGDLCGVRLDHREICKPAGRDCFLYQELIKLINNAASSPR